VSPETIQEILNTGDQCLINQAWDHFTVEDMTRYLESLPSRTFSQQVTPQESPRTLNQADLQRRLRMLLQDQEQFAQGRKIANITTTNSILTKL